MPNDPVVLILIGAAGALFVAKSMGWLKLPFLDKSPVAGASPPVMVYQPPSPDSGPAYEATINVPHKITVTPQVNK